MVGAGFGAGVGAEVGSGVVGAGVGPGVGTVVGPGVGFVLGAIVVVHAGMLQNEGHWLRISMLKKASPTQRRASVI